jgi:hypothetical protein
MRLLTIPVTEGNPLSHAITASRSVLTKKFLELLKASELKPHPLKNAVFGEVRRTTSGNSRRPDPFQVAAFHAQPFQKLVFGLVPVMTGLINMDESHAIAFQIRPLQKLVFGLVAPTLSNGALCALFHGIAFHGRPFQKLVFGPVVTTPGTSRGNICGAKTPGGNI